MLEHTGLDCVGQCDCVARAFDVGDDLRIGVGLQVVHRRQVEEVPDLAAELLHIRLGHAEQRLL
jgi:hypothetical protein